MKPSSNTPFIPVNSPDLEILRKFEPVVHFTKGEQFFPFQVERYIAQCSLWAHYPDGKEEQLVKQEEMDLEKLIEQRPANFRDHSLFTVH